MMKTLQRCISQYNLFLDTMSPLSEQSLSSPVEDGGGYQSEVRRNKEELSFKNY